jgi:hypothetical protein
MARMRELIESGNLAFILNEYPIAAAAVVDLPEESES